jgi:hypothetical protein
MRMIFCMLFLSLFLGACIKDPGLECSATQAQDTNSPNCTVVADPSSTGDATPTDEALSTEAYTFGANIEFLNADSTQEDKFNRAIDMIKKVVATEAFKNKVLNHTYNGVKTFVDNDGLTNAQIYQKILEAAELLYPAKNNTMDMEVQLYYAPTSTVGYTYANSSKIWVNTKYFNSNSTGGVAANLFHEWLHKIGFTHASSYSVSRDYSVPYAIGRMISSLGATL